MPPSYCAAVLTLILATATANATPLFSVTIQDPDSRCLSSPSGSSPISVNLACAYTGGAFDLFSGVTAQLSSSADYTTLSALLQWDSITTGNGTLGGGLPVGPVAIATSDDMLTVSGGVGPGTLRATYTLNGTNTLGTRASASAILFVQTAIGTLFLNDSGTLVVDIPFTFGVPTALSAALTVRVGSDGLSLPPLTAVVGTADYSHTAALQPFLVLNADGQSVDGAKVSGSDFHYAVASNVPEPGTGLLLGASILLVLGRYTVKRAGGSSKNP